MEAIGKQSSQELREMGYSLLPSQVAFHLNYALRGAPEEG